MHLFIRKIIAFLLFSSILTATIILLINDRIKKVALCRVSSNVRYIALGHSHTQHAFNDSLISDFKNFGYAAESYFYTLIKTRMVVEQNKNIKVVFIEFSNNQIISEMDSWTWGERVSSRYNTVTPFMRWDEHALILKNNLPLFINNLSVSTKEGLGNLITKKLDYSDKIGWYSGFKQNNLDSILAQLRPENAQMNFVTELSVCNIKYLKLLINYCETQGKKVILIRSPLHKKYPLLANEPVYKYILNLEFQNQEYLDFSRFPLADSEFGDLQHINYRGAAKFSRWFSKLLKDGLIYQKDKQQFINERMKLVE